MIAALVRGLVLLSLASAMGGVVLGLLLSASAAPELEAARARLRRWVAACLLILLVATWAELLVRTQSMSGASLGASVAAVPSILTGTHFGQILAVRAAAAVVSLLLLAERAGLFQAFVLLVMAGIVLTLSLTGHAADWGDVTLAVAVDWVHAVAASAWTGGVTALVLVAGRREAPWSRESLAAVVPRFSRLAGICLLAVAVTGSSNAWTQLGGFSRLVTTAYGRVLIAKLAAVAVLVWLGALNRYVLLPRLAPERAARGPGARAFRMVRLAAFGPSRGATAGPVESRLLGYVTVEALVGLAVFACTAMLGEITPGRHVTFERKTTTHVAPLGRAGAGGPRPGTVTPPRGDVGRGRAVFAKLECGGCHAVPDPGFAAPTRPGPDLAGIGARHPGEIVESIMNPNAQILDGPGYTDERGLSIMPDYRDRLTVGELSDLVEYLRTFEAPAPPAEKPPATEKPPAEKPPAVEQPGAPGQAPASGEPPARERQP